MLPVEYDRDKNGRTPEAVRAFEKWTAEKDVTHVIASDEQLLMVPANPIYGTKHTLEQY